MHIRIEQIKDEGLSLEFEEKPEIFPVLSKMIDQGECEFVAPIKAALRAIRIGDMFEVEGIVNTAVRLPCSRCLMAYETLLKFSFALTYVRLIPVARQEDEPAEVELSAEEMELIYFQGEEIHLQDGIQEQIIMGFPIKALCRENCKGLCSKCGNDLNARECGCDRQAPNGKFAALKNLKLNNR